MVLSLFDKRKRQYSLYVSVYQKSFRTGRAADIAELNERKLSVPSFVLVFAKHGDIWAQMITHYEAGTDRNDDAERTQFAWRKPMIIQPPLESCQKTMTLKIIPETHDM
jgi:hypothetical protein